jgi:hypothetical protein
MIEVHALAGELPTAVHARFFLDCVQSIANFIRPASATTPSVFREALKPRFSSSGSLELARSSFFDLGMHCHPNPHVSIVRKAPKMRLLRLLISPNRTIELESLI